jgi:hypothetical protein
VRGRLIVSLGVRKGVVRNALNVGHLFDVLSVPETRDTSHKQLTITIGLSQNEPLSRSLDVDVVEFTRRQS